jgi:predicted  nucleic acid-binding Zn-ribbon protein
MHEDLAAVLSLWTNVSAADRLKSERTALGERAGLLAAAVGTAEHAHTEAQRALQEILEVERQVMRKLDAYRKRIETTRAMIDAGKAPDYRLADQQLRTCAEIADQLETEALEAMERRDAAEAQLADASAALAQATERQTQHSARAEIRRPQIEAELSALEAARPGLEDLVPEANRAAFAALRSRGRSAVAQLKAGACSVCNYGSPPQTVLEIQGDVRVHVCRNCGRFLLPEVG